MGMRICKIAKITLKVRKKLPSEFWLSYVHYLNSIEMIFVLLVAEQEIELVCRDAFEQVQALLSSI